MSKLRLERSYFLLKRVILAIELGILIEREGAVFVDLFNGIAAKYVCKILCFYLIRGKHLYPLFPKIR